MNEVDIHPATTSRFIDRLPEAFLTGDDAPAAKVAESRNVARLQEQYRAIARGDFPTVLADLAEGIELEIHAPPDFPANGHWRGLPEVVAAMRKNYSALAEQEAELLSVVAQGDTVVLLAQERGKVRATGKKYHLRWAQFFTFRGDKVIRISSVAAHLPDSE